MHANGAQRGRQDLQSYRTLCDSHADLEREFRRDFGERQPLVLRGFFALGLALYMSFAILDYWALPVYYPTAWALRLLFGLGDVPADLPYPTPDSSSATSSGFPPRGPSGRA